MAIELFKTVVPNLMDYVVQIVFDTYLMTTLMDCVCVCVPGHARYLVKKVLTFKDAD